MGNSEVGHITIGAGRIVNQFLRRFQIEEDGGRLPQNPALNKFMTDVKKDGGVVHILGLTSDIGVHADMKEMIPVAKIILNAGLNICVHFISDGRDTPPSIAMKYADQLMLEFATEIDMGRLWFGTLIGRYYAMDRNLNWDRTQLAFDAIVMGNAEYTAPDVKSAITDAYARGETDEFIKPTAITPPDCAIDACREIRPIDGILFTNFRADRARQIMQALGATKTPNVRRPAGYVPPHMLGFSQYGGETDDYIPALLPDIPIKNTLGDVLVANGRSQLRISETEKYTHATYYIDGERTLDYPNEEKILIPSPSVPTFDLAPEMSAQQITDKVLARLSKFDVILINYANGDIIGHTGIESAAVKTLKTIDSQLRQLVPAVLALDGTILITADHGNVEKMWDSEHNAPHTAHTTNPVQFIVVGACGAHPGACHAPLRAGGGLADIAPTMLKILGIAQPSEMTGESLI